MTSHTEECAECSAVLHSVERHSQESCFQCIDIAVTLLNNRPRRAKNKGDRRLDRNRKLDELLEKVTALRNSKGGLLLVHITGLSEGDRFLGYFDEFADEKLNKLIEDGKQFVDTYSRFWLSEKEGFSNYKEFVCLTVKASCSISTCDFKTKILLDCAIENPTTTNILSLLTERRKFSCKPPVVRGSSRNLSQLNESRNIQLKAFKTGEEKQEALLNDPALLCDYIWYSLRLREYISAFTKLEGGGSFLLGIEEIEEVRETEGEEYFTKVLQIHGVPLPEDIHKALSDKLRDVVKKELLVADYDGQRVITPSDLIDVVFHDASDHALNNSRNAEIYVIEITVRQTTGIVFYDSSGPKSFRIVNKRIVPVEGKKWFQMIRKLKESFKENR